jgi:type IV pilus assembly protein PilE
MKRNFGKNRGFTLLELMIVIAIVAVLVALAVPSYTSWVQKAARGEAQALLLTWANNQEIWRAGDTDYATDTEIVPPTHDRYNFALAARGTNNYTLRATTKGPQVGDNEKGTLCNTLELTETGLKTPSVCWRE